MTLSNLAADILLGPYGKSHKDLPSKEKPETFPPHKGTTFSDIESIVDKRVKPQPAPKPDDSEVA